MQPPEHVAARTRSEQFIHLRPAAYTTVLAVLLCVPVLSNAQNSAIANASRSASGLKFSLGGEVTFTDNIGLRSSNETAGSIWRVTPGLSWNHQSSHLTSHVGLGWSFTTTSPSNGSDTSQLTLDSNLQGAFLDRDLLIDVTGRIANQDSSPFSIPTPAGGSGYNNQVQTRYFSVSPSYRNHLGGWDYQVGYRLSNSSASNSALTTSTSQGVNANINNGRSSPILVTSLLANSQRYETSNRPSYSITTTQLREDWHVNNQLSLFASGGNEYDGYLLQNSNNAIYDAGFSWLPGPRTSLSVTAGHRYYGESHSISLSHRTRRTVWQFSSSKSAVHSQDQFAALELVTTAEFLARIPDSADRARIEALLRTLNGGVLPAVVGAQLAAVLSDSEILSEKQNLSVTWLGVNNTVIFSAFRGTSSQISNNLITASFSGTSTLSLGNEIKQRGYSLLWSYKLSAQSSANLAYTNTLSEAAQTGLETDAKTLSLGYERRLSAKTSVGGSVRHFKSTSSANNDVTENAVTAHIRTEF